MDKEARKNARKLLKLFGPNGEHWTTKKFAKDKRGRVVEYDDPKAFKFCLLGGCKHLGIPSKFLYDVVPPDPKHPNFFSVSCFNDADGFEPVKDFLTKIANGKI